MTDTKPDGVHAMIPRSKMIPGAAKLRDTYDIKPGAPFFQREFGYYSIEKWKSEEGMPTDAPLEELQERRERITDLETARNELRFADQGYSGFFSEIKWDSEDVLAAISSDDVCIVDALPEPFFLGAAKLYPELRAGHIPGACNVAAPANLDPATSTLLSPEKLEELWTSAGVSRGKRVITYCGGGVFAAFALFALHLLGYENTALYDASWSEWGADESLPVETGPGN